MESLMAVQAETETAKLEIQRIKRETEKLDSKQMALQAQLRKAGGSVSVHQHKNRAGYTLMHLILVALLAYVVGRLLTTVALPF
jgi:hypothetical protein